MKSVCVFCGSKVGKNLAYGESARRLGALLAMREILLVYGGGQVGLMGVLADAVLDSGGEVEGVIPGPLATKELLHPRATRMHVTPTMHARKAKMAELADAFVVLPGGFGTFEEFFEVVTWAQLGIHQKPVGVLNVAGYFDPLLALVENAIEEGFIRPALRGLLVVSDSEEALLEKLATHEPPQVHRWLDPEAS